MSADCRYHQSIMSALHTVDCRMERTTRSDESPPEVRTSRSQFLSATIRENSRFQVRTNNLELMGAEGFEQELG